MASRRGGLHLRQIRILFETGSTRELTDGQLLERFALGHGEASEVAFAVLVERHGPMVWRVCRATLVDPNDVDDAFQATFLVLVCKARDLWVRDSIGPWLHQVASRTANFARHEAIRRRTHLERSIEICQKPDEPIGDEIERVIHEEIANLPDRDRAVVVLCDLGERSYESAATHLGLPVGTLKSRLSRARERLRQRLRRRGFGPMIIPALMSGPPLQAAAVDSLARLAVRSIASRPAVSGPISHLVQGVLVAMNLMHVLKVGAIVAGVATAVAAGAWAAPQGRSEAKKAENLAVSRLEVTKAEPSKDGEEVVAEAPKSSVVQVTPSVFKWRESAIQASVQPAHLTDVLCPVAGKSTVTSILPNRTRVKKGEVVCKLDTSALIDQLRNQQHTRMVDEGAYQTARLARDVAEIAMRSFVGSTYKLSLDAANREITLAKDSLAREKRRLLRTQDALKRMTTALGGKGAATASDIVAELDLQDRLDAAEQAVAHEAAALELLEGKRVVLETYTKEKTVKELTVALESAKAGELVKENALKLAQNTEEHIKLAIANSTLTAPRDGMVMLTLESPAFTAKGVAQRPIDEGATVREGQFLFRVGDARELVTEAWFLESQLADIKPGLKASMPVQSSYLQLENGRYRPTLSLVGEVIAVSDRTEGEGATKYHRVKIRVLPPIAEGIGLGEQVSATITGEKTDVITVPMQALVGPSGPYVRPGGPGGGGSMIAGAMGGLGMPGMGPFPAIATFVLVKNADGTYDARTIQTGHMNGLTSTAEVLKGLKAGETVLTNFETQEAKVALQKSLDAARLKVMQGRRGGNQP